MKINSGALKVTVGGLLALAGLSFVSYAVASDDFNPVSLILAVTAGFLSFGHGCYMIKLGFDSLS